MTFLDQKMSTEVTRNYVKTPSVLHNFDLAKNELLKWWSGNHSVHHLSMKRNIPGFRPSGLVGLSGSFRPLLYFGLGPPFISKANILTILLFTLIHRRNLAPQSSRFGRNLLKLKSLGLDNRYSYTGVWLKFSPGGGGGGGAGVVTPSNPCFKITII